MAAKLTHLGKYEIVAEIGRGGFAVVYRARHARTGQEVALKVIAGNYADDPAFVERFHQEARTAAALRHPHIVPVYDFDQDQGFLYLAMPFIQGRTLRGLLDERKRLALEEALPILTQLAEALDYLHSQGLVHRDVKPSNVLLEREECDLCVALADFGLVRSLESSTALTRTSSILGTPTYLAPEQAAAEQWGPITPLTDVYTLGVVVYEMLVGRPPFLGEFAAVVNAHANTPPPSPLDLGADLAEVLLRGLTKPPDQRYPGAGALVAALRQVAEARTRREHEKHEMAELLEKIQAARQDRRWLDVQSLCTQVLQLDRAHPDTLGWMVEATQEIQRESADEAARRQRARRYEQGLAALEAEDWETAISALEEVHQQDPDFRDVAAKLTQARAGRDRAAWYDQAIAQAGNEKWAEACRLWVQILRGRWDYRDAPARLLDATDGLLGRWDELLKELQRQQRELKASRQALGLFDALAAAVEAQDWKKVVETGEQLSKLVPNLDRPPAWLARARAALERQSAPAGDTMVWEKDGKTMVRVPAGEFLYGDDGLRRELPEFWIDKTPVTNAEFARFVEATSYPTTAEQKGTGWAWTGKEWKETKGADWRHPSGPGTGIQTLMNHPVVQISWHDAVAYAEWVGKRLPTEEEWEKAARGTDARKYPWGDQEPTPKLCNFGNNERGTTPVGKYSPHGDSPYGCVDMAGNVWEWTASDYDSSHKVLRGGSWNGGADGVRSAARGNYTPDSRAGSVGFRCVGAPGP